jgi:hypothetical protein
MSCVAENGLTNKSQGITEFDPMEYPLQARSAIGFSKNILEKDTHGKRDEN